MRQKTGFILALALVLGMVAPLTSAQSECALATQLAGYRAGHVAFSDGSDLNVRDTPSRAGQVIGTVPEGENFGILSAESTCADGINWYQIQVGEVQGWAAEGTSEEGFFILPKSIDLGGADPASVQLVYVDAYGSDASAEGGQLILEDGNCGELAPVEVDYSEFGEGFIELAPRWVVFYNNYLGLPMEVGTNDYITVGPPICTMGVRYYPQIYGNFEFIPESVDGVYVVQPFALNPLPSGVSVAASTPQITQFTHPLPTVTPDESLFVNADWVWEPIYDQTVPDPSQMVLPDSYQGNMPDLPVDLSGVIFVQDANLSDDALTKLATNGFVVVPGGYDYFDTAYYGETSWDVASGHASFVTTDTMLNSLYFVYENTQQYLELEALYGVVNQTVAATLSEALLTYDASIGTPLFPEARSAALYYVVAAMLLNEGLFEYSGSYPNMDGVRTAHVLDSVPNDLLEEANAVVTLIKSAQGQAKISFMDDYDEDFSQYKPRSYYAGNPVLESYFRGMMWLGRITFRAKSDFETRTGVLALRALKDSGMLPALDEMNDTLLYLVGPADDLTYTDLLPLATRVYGEDMALSAIVDNEGAGTLAAYRDGLNALPGPRINGMILPVGVTADQVDPLTRGFRVFGQRFTFDGYAIQNLIFPKVGTQELFRSLPTAEDVPSVLGSDFAYAQIADDAQFANFVENMSQLRGEVNSTTSAGWSETFYGAWLHAIQPLLVRNEAILPPLMLTDAWKARDLNAALGSYAELKHATLLYAEQPYGGRGGGGGVPPLTAFGYVEPNPLVFARVSILATTLHQQLEARGYVVDNRQSFSKLDQVMQAADRLAQLSAELAEIARREIAGESLTDDQYRLLQDYFPDALGAIRTTIQDLQSQPPRCTAIVADIATNPSTNQILYVGTGGIDTIYVITEGPYGLHVTRGAVYSSYSYVGDAQSRLTDDDWRLRFGTDAQPARPAWAGQYMDTLAPDNLFTCEPTNGG